MLETVWLVRVSGTSIQRIGLGSIGTQFYWSGLEQLWCIRYAMSWFLWLQAGYLARPPADRKLRTIRPFSLRAMAMVTCTRILIFIARITLVWYCAILRPVHLTRFIVAYFDCTLRQKLDDIVFAWAVIGIESTRWSNKLHSHRQTDIIHPERLQHRRYYGISWIYQLCNKAIVWLTCKKRTAGSIIGSPFGGTSTTNAVSD